ncbi:hypothetical protein [Microbispora bryophytorum]|uniref:hypothetical protein n=1 Tax=Microbispora bryophytorum TaxID=1460882 RepID=UPI00371533A3
MSFEQELTLLESVLDRTTALDPLGALRGAMVVQARAPIDLTKVAFGIDSNIFLRLANAPRSEDLLDFLASHSAPLILPSQAVQEFWNNRKTITTISDDLKSRFSALSKTVDSIDANFGEFERRFGELLSEFEAEFGYLYHGQILDRVVKMLELLKEKAHCYSVPRSRFATYAKQRKLARTPPGFEDKGDGDFYVWADFLYGLLICRRNSNVPQFEHIVLLTDDNKKDWSSYGIPHPVLTAEVQSLFGVPFSIWGLKVFAERVEKFYAGQ